MVDLPPPLVPPEVNTTGDDWFPWYFHRIRKSKWWRRASDLARARNVMLWGEAYQQTPAGSLSDDDDELAEAAGFGFDVEAFLAHKAEIMGPWTRCSDGRWYHPTLCEVVLDSWERQGAKRKSESARKAEYRRRIREQRPADKPAVPVKADVVPRDTPAKPGAKTTVSRGTPPLVPPGLGLQTDKTDRHVEDADASLSLVSDDEQPTAPKYPSDFEACWKAYPHAKGRSSKSKSLGAFRRLPPARRKALPSAIARYASEGREPKAECGAPAMERWLARDLDLNWHDGPDRPAAATTWSGPADVRAAVLAEPNGDRLVAFLDRCGYRNGPDNLVTSPNGFVVDTLRREVGHVLSRFGLRAVVEGRSGP